MIKVCADMGAVFFPDKITKSSNHHFLHFEDFYQVFNWSFSCKCRPILLLKWQIQGFKNCTSHFWLDAKTPQFKWF